MISNDLMQVKEKLMVCARLKAKVRRKTPELLIILFTYNYFTKIIT
jgi:hypothetical protein